MFIREITSITNYRNLSGQHILFDANVNYLIGENNIGKTNILELLYIFFCMGKFNENDFFDTTKPIDISLRIEYSDDEIGFFEEYFDVDQENSISIHGIQTDIDDRITYYHDTPNQSIIPATTIKKINSLYYFAQRMPSKELDFRKTSGSGKVLNFLIQHSMRVNGVNEQDIINQDTITNIVDCVNEHISKLNTITGDSVAAYYDNEPGKVLCRVLGLGDSAGRELALLGEGIQYAFNIVLQIVESIYNIKATRKSDDFQKRLVSIGDKRLFPILVILDEPEIHQHPYRQRSIIKKIEGLIQNENEDFCILLKEMFDIDGLIGQMFISTHSPNILSNDYKQFIRLTKKGDELQIYCGYMLNLESTKMYKHLLRSFMSFKEAMFSRAILFVEGDTENGAVPVIATRLGYELDNLGVGIVKLDGADSVLPCMELFTNFGITVKTILDKDKLAVYQGKSNIYYTNGLDFEEDVYDSFGLKDYIACKVELDSAMCYIGVLKKEGVVFEPRNFPESVDWEQISPEQEKRIMTSEKANQLAALRGSKNAAKGSILATCVTSIPQAFSHVLNELLKEVLPHD